MSAEELDIPLFAEVSPVARRALIAAAVPVRVAAGEPLFHAGDPAGALYVVLTGRLTAVDPERGSAIRAMGRGAVIGELSVVTGEPRSATVVAHRDSSLLAVPREAMAAVLEAEPSVARALLRSVSDRLRTARAPVGGGAGPGGGPPATVAVLGVAGAPVEEAAGLLARALQEAGPVAVVVRPPDGDLVGPAERIDRLEREGRRALLVAGPQDAAWTAFCRRQADATVWVAGAGPGGGLPADADPRMVLGMAGQDVHGRVAVLARRLSGRSIGLVLSGGGARGLAHIGAIEALLAAGVTVDRVAGCSSGALVGALLASGRAPDEIAAVLRAELVERNPLRDYTVPLVSLLRGQHVRDMLVRCFGERRVEDLPCDYFCVSTDLVSSSLVVHRTGLVHRAVGASMSLPGIGPPVVDGDRLLVDGGVLDNLPVATMAAAGEGPVIAVDVSAPFAAPAASAGPGAGRPRVAAARARVRSAMVGDAGGEHGRLPSLRETMMRAVTLGAADEAAAAARHAALVVRPPVQGVGLFAFARLDELRAAGRAAAEQALAATPDWAADGATRR